MLLLEEVFVPFDSSRRTYDRARRLKWPFSAILVLTQSNFPMSWGPEIWHTHRRHAPVQCVHARFYVNVAIFVQSRSKNVGKIMLKQYFAAYCSIFFASFSFAVSMKFCAIMLLLEEVFCAKFDSSRSPYDRVRRLKWPFSAILVLKSHF